MKNNYSEQELLESRFKGQLRRHREELNLGQLAVASSLCKSYSTYQRWESTGKHLTNIFDILAVFRELRFSTPEIIELLGLPPLTLSDMEALCPDEGTLKGIKECGVYSYVRRNCGSMDDVMFRKLFSALCAEYAKRH